MVSARLRNMPATRTTVSHRRLRFTSTLEESGNRLWGCHVGVPPKIAWKILAGGSRRVVFSLNGSSDHQRAMLPRGDGSFVITVNAQLRATLHLAVGMIVEVCIRRDESDYGLPMPGELSELLRQDAAGHQLFHALTPGKRRTLLYVVGSVRDPERRALRAVIVLWHLKANNGRVNYKQLYTQLGSR